MNKKSLALYLHVYIQSDRKCVSYWRTIVSGVSPAPLCLSQNRFNKGEHRDPRIYDIITYPMHYLAFFFLNQGRLKLMFAFFFFFKDISGRHARFKWERGTAFIWFVKFWLYFPFKFWSLLNPSYAPLIKHDKGCDVSAIKYHFH